MSQQNIPLPGCNFVVHSSPAHYSPSHLGHNPPDALVSTQHLIKPILPNGGLGSSTTNYHSPYIGQTTLPMYKIGV